MNKRPILFLDVDGVLNCYEHPDCEELRTSGGLTYVPRGTRERVARLLEVFEPVWATAWRGSAHAHHRDHLELSDTPWRHVDWEKEKLPSILRYAGDRPWAFVDDDAGWELSYLHPAFGEIPNTLIVVPDPEVGLTDEHVDRLLAFAEGLDGSSNS